MSRVCFVSYEIHPTVSGGCGVLLYNTARVLLAQGHEVIFLLDLDHGSFQHFNTIDRLNLPNSENCRAYQVNALVSENKPLRKSFVSQYEYQSYRFHVAASQVYRLEQPDVIEFFEYLGVAYHALSAKAAGLDYQKSHLAVRLHSSMELIDRCQPGNIHNLDRYIMYNLERQALRLAESVLYPSKGFLDKAYKPSYESWFGEEVLSPPALVDRPDSELSVENPNIILYYGRLCGIKGVDRFVDAAVLYLSDADNPRREFYLVGYDAEVAPDSSGSYQKYLLKKIPGPYKKFFHFTGQLSWKEVGKILPGTLFAVIPSYFESFCYAAHELYEANVPLIVSDIPAFVDSFQHEKNALVFDGTVSGLAHQMERLSTDAVLLQKIRHPFSVLSAPLGDFYSRKPAESWITGSWSAPGGLAADLPTLLVCILCDQPGKLLPTLQSLKDLPAHRIKLVVASPKQDKDEGKVYSWFLGRLYAFEDANGNPLYPTQIKTSEALLILKAGDRLSPRFVSLGLDTLARQPQISYVGSWKKSQGGLKQKLESTGLDASPELLPFSKASTLSRCILRTLPDNLLIDLFDSRAGQFGEIAHLWRLDAEESCGLTIPEPLITRTIENRSLLNTNVLDYLFLSDSYLRRKTRVARYFLSLEHRSTVLLKNKHELFKKQVVLDQARKIIYWLGSSRMNIWMNRMPRVKRSIRNVAETLGILKKKPLRESSEGK